MLDLPDYKRRHYRDTYLSRVILQIRFPPVLRIASDSPVELQDEIRDEYPEYEREVDAPVQLGPAGAEMDDLGVTHHFFDRNEEWVVRLSQQELSLVANAYTTWEEASARFQNAANSVWEFYEPAAVRRVGFLYQDIFEKVDASSPAVWNDFFRRDLIAPFSNDALHAAVQGAREVILLEHDDHDVRIAVEAKTGETDEGESAQRLDLDFDMFRADLDVDLETALERLETCHETLIGLFEWSITDDLRRDMNPEEPIDE